MATSNVRILVVDDERFYRGAIREILAAEGLVCVEAEGGERAVELARDEAVGVVVLDLRLANDDALDVLRRLNELRPELRVVVLSASSDQELVLDALRLGACDYLAKPLHDEELVLAIQRAVESYRLSAGWAGLRSRLDGIVGRMEALSRLAGVAKDDERRELIHEAAARIVSGVLEAEKTSLMTLDDEAGSLYVSAVRGRDLAPGAMDPVLVGEGAAGMVLESGEPLLVADVKADARFAGRAPTGRYQTHSFVLAPLEARGRFIGVLCATDRADGSELEWDDLLLLRVLAVQVAELLAAGSPADEEASYGLQDDLHIPKDLDPDAELARLVCDAVVNEVEPERVVRAALRPLAEFLPASPVSLYLVDGQISPSEARPRTIRRIWQRGSSPRACAAAAEDRP